MRTELRTVEGEAADAAEAVTDWDTFISRRRNRYWLTLRITHLTHACRFDEIPQTASYLHNLNPNSSLNLYNAASGYALCAGAIEAVDGESLTTEQQFQRQEYIDLALACLRESIAFGWSDFEHMQQDPDLAVLRDLPEFQSLLPMPMVPEAEEQ